MKTRAWFLSRGYAAAWFGLLGLAVALRAYHLPGFVVNNDEGHWLIYALDKRLLFEPMRNSYPRPDLLFPLMISPLVGLFGPNELALRLLPALVGSLSLFPLAALVFQLTKNRAAALCAAAFLAVLPLHVYFSAQGIPDTIALFFGLCALVFMVRASQTKELMNFVWMGIWMALALLTKATALYLWGFLAIAGILLLDDRRSRRWFYAALISAAIPLSLVTLVILQRSHTLSFFREPGITEKFGFSLARLGMHLRYGVVFYDVLLLVAVVGMILTIVRATKGTSADRRLLVWLVPLGNLFITPLFRVGRLELLWLIPSLCLFAAVAVGSLRLTLARVAAGVVMAILLARSLFGIPLPDPGRARAASDYTTAVLRRPAGWPSRDAGRWLRAATSPEDTILITAYTFTDPLLLELGRSRRLVPNGGENWGLLRDPANRVKYAVFTQDYRAYAPSLAAYADAHFTLAGGAQFPGYTIYDCQKDGRFVAYPDAFSQSNPYVRQGMEFLQQHDLERAYEAFQKGLTIEPDQPVAGVNLALLCLQLGRDEEGVARCEQNIRLRIEPSISYGVLGQFREKRGDYAGARAAYEKSLAIDPHNQTTLQLLANLPKTPR
ncbi:MAG TPA: glycosyltransferase family 39 protein [Verrucomicrobiae bacterium]|nr:glycosyltransferase family 39 protein [Verrucomicrobiae bacterium]